MISIHNGDVQYPLPVEAGDWYIHHKYDGYDALVFEMPAKHDTCKYVAEEARVSTNDNQYKIVNIDEHGGTVTVDCDIDLDDWQERFWPSFRVTNKLLSEVLEQIRPANWTVSGAGVSTIKATVEASEGMPMENVNAEAILSRTAETYSVVFNFDVPNQILYVVVPETYTPSGEFMTDELNLRSLGFVGNSKDLVTRLYAYGKKNEKGKALTFASVNGGKEYVEDTSYSNRIISMGWSDERYTTAKSLLAAAKKKLKELSRPVRSYECDVINLKGDIWMYKVVTLIDRNRKTRIDHQVVEYKEFPGRQDLDVVTLAAAAPRIEGNLKQIRAEINDKKAETQNFVLNSVNHATDLITGAQGGNVVTLRNAEGKPTAILVMDTEDVLTAQNLWQWNIAGLGHSSNGINGPYGTAITMDGRIVADYITTGTLQGVTIIARHKDGSWTQMDGDGLTHRDGSTKVTYHYLVQNGSTTIVKDKFTDNHDAADPKKITASVTIQLPAAFKGKNIIFNPYFQGIEMQINNRSNPYHSRETLHSFGFKPTIDKANAKVTLQITCAVWHEGGQYEGSGGVINADLSYYCSPKNLTVGYTAIA